MNQAIIIADDQHWQPLSQRVEFSASHMGAKILCAISKESLEHLVGLALNDEHALLEAYQSVQFDIEELVERKIEQEDFDANGSVVL